MACLHCGGVFAQRAHSGNNYAVYPGNTPANHPPTDACMINLKKPRGSRMQDPGTRGKHQTKQPGVPAGAVGCRFQEFRTRGYRGWKTADFSHSARCAPCVRRNRPRSNHNHSHPHNHADAHMNPVVSTLVHNCHQCIHTSHVLLGV